MRETATWLGLLLGAANALASTTGTVTALDGTTLAGAEIHAHAPESLAAERRRLMAGGDQPPLASATSDESGSFALPVADGGVIRVVVELDGYAPWAEEVLAGEDLGAVLLRQAPRVRGSVRTDGRPLAGARVIWRDPQLRPLWITETDARGSYEVPDPKRWAESVAVLHPRVGVHDPSSGLDTLTLHEPWHADDGPPLELTPSRGRSVRGQVVAEGRPVAGAEITAAAWPLASSDDDGRFTIRVPEDAVVQARAGARWGWAATDTDDEVTIELGEPRSLRVTVEDSRGRGLAGAVMQIFSSGEAPFTGRFVADPAGRIEVDGLPAAELALWVETPGYQVEDRYQQIDLRQNREAEIRLSARPMTRARGRVVDDAGRPVGGALVMYGGHGVIYGVENGTKRAPRSGDDGRFDLLLPLAEGETASLVVLARGQAARAVKLAAAESGDAEPVEVRLPAGMEAAFAVTDTEGEPVAGVTVAIVEGAPRSGLSPQELVTGGDIAWLYRTDATGRVRARLSPGIHQLGFHTPGFAPLGVTRYDARPGAEPLRIVLRPGAVIEGRVTTLSGKPPGPTVVLVQGEAFDRQHQTDDDGHFRFEDLSAGTYVVTAVVFGAAAPAPVTVEAPVRGVTLQLDDGVELSGIVRDRSTGLPIAKAVISAEVAGIHDERSNIASTVTEDDGRFTLSGARAGRVVLQASADGFLDGVTEEIVIIPAEPTPEVEIELEPGLTLSGRVTDDHGEPLTHVAVEVDGSPSRQGATDASGEYLVHGVTPGTVTVIFTSEDFLTLEDSIELAAPGGQLDVELERGEILRGVVRDLEGKAIEGAQVRGRSRGAGGSKWSQSDDQGAFELRGLAAGEWQLRVAKSGFAEQKRTRAVPSPAPALEVILEPIATGTVIGTVRGADRVEGAALSVYVLGSGTSADTEVEADGTYRAEDAPAGDVTVRLSVSAGDDERNLKRRAVVPRNGRVRVDFDLEDAPRIRGRVVRGEEPVPIAYVGLERVGNDDEASTRTDAGGWFEVAIEEGHYEVSVWTMDGGQHYERRRITASSILEIDIAPAKLAGRVIDAITGQGLAGAEVELRPRVRGEEQGLYNLPDVTTDSRGRFVIAGAPIGRFMLRAHAAEFAPKLLEVELEGGIETSVEIVLEPAEGLDVVLFDARSGQPLKGSVVARLPSDTVIWDGNAPRSGDGVRLPLGPGAYKVSVSASGYASQTLPARIPAREPLRVGLTPGGTVVVRSQSLARRVARLIAPDGEEYVRCWCNQISAFSVEGSETTLENIAPGSYTLEVQELDGTSQAVPLQVFEGLSVELAVH